MNPKRSLILAALSFLTTIGYSQSQVYLESFGSTGFGLSLNYEKQIDLSENSKIGVTLGMGIRHVSRIDPNFWLYKTGINYYYKVWGIGLDASFHNAIGTTSQTSYAETEAIIYPNINYNWNFVPNWYLKPSIGVAFSALSVINPELNPSLSQDNFWDNSFYFGFTIGRLFRNK